MSTFQLLLKRSRTLKVSDAKLSRLVIREANAASGLHFFWRDAEKRLVSDFSLKVRPQVDTMCRVTLIKVDAGYSARLNLWKWDKTAKAKAETEMPVTGETRPVKASVDLEDCHEEFWKLTHWLESFIEITFPANTFKVVDEESADIAAALQGKAKGEMLQAVKAHVPGDLTEADVSMLVDRKKQLEHFRRLLWEQAYFEAQRQQTKGKKWERVWQDFFELNQWIFGY